MAELNFDDLIPAQGANTGVSFDDLIPAAPAPQYFGPGAGEFAGTQTPETIQNPGQKLASVPQRIGANLPFADRIHAGVNALAGSGTYDQNLADVRAYDEQRRKEDPYGEAAYTVAGGLLPATAFAKAIGTAAKAVPLGIQMARSAFMGGGLAAANEASNVPDYSHVTAQDVKNVGVGTGAGAVTGWAAPAIGKGIGWAYNKAANAINGRVPGLASPAQRWLTDDLMADSPHAASQELQRLGPQGMVGDATPAFQATASGLRSANDPGPKSTIVNAFTQRNAGGNQRVDQALTESFAPNAPGGSIKNVNPDAELARMEAQRAQIGGQIPGVLANGPQKIDVSSPLASIGQQLNTSVGDVSTFLNRTKKLLTEPVLDPQGKVIAGRIAPITDPTKLHNAKMQLDSWIKAPPGDLRLSQEALSNPQGAIATVRGALNGALRDQVPGYGDVMDQLSSLRRQELQVGLGQNTVLGSGPKSLHPGSFETSFNALPPVEQDANRIGLAGDVGRIVGTSGNDLNAANKAFQGPGGWNQQKLATAFGPGPTQQAADTLAAEKTMRDNYNQIVHNSMTTPRAQMTAALQNTDRPPLDIIPNMSRVTLPGMGLQPLSWLGNKAINAFRPIPDIALRNSQMANALTQQGPDAQALIAALHGAAANQNNNAILAEALRRGTAIGMVGGEPSAIRHYLPKPGSSEATTQRQ